MSGLRFPRILPAHYYRDPAEILEQRVITPALAVVSTTLPQTLCRVQTHAPRDRFYTQARRLHIQTLMRARR
jgi:hypothetical protein